MLTTTYSPPRPVGLQRTLAPLRRGHGDPTFRVEGRDVWRTLRTPIGPATLHLRRTPDGVEATAWGDGAEWAIAGVPELLGEGDDWSDLDVSASPVLAASLHRNPGLRLMRTRQVFEMMLAAILEQKVTGEQARQSWRALLRKYGSPAPGPAPAGMLVFPPAEVWRRVPSWEWHRAGVGPERAAAALRAAGVAASLERTLEQGRGGVEVERALRSIPGIGVWTAAETMQRAHGDPDRPSVGDYHLPALVGWALIGRPVDDDGMLELLAPYAGHRQRVMRLIENSGIAKPRFGPRMTIQDHRGH
ncbi:DNA-3-methyladenine glycosylase family protein [Salinibacterium soli]|uniref:DNA-3-methyladenine glycosylase 2 family protein n=1 Tax=Antiquaquibacter soli TaxID=3064523 RepID=A0ABT9BRC7_9MICO|nr:DNA-3-methyladenine glycosylase 2 family protein [Protaetiibacter sp. WY-16]MDO7883575.1 DNA-3-methyladenine glycosylase 2 family protein [Protaetiibacter sp. WY-16]